MCFQLKNNHTLPKEGILSKILPPLEMPIPSVGRGGGGEGGGMNIFQNHTIFKE